MSFTIATRIHVPDDIAVRVIDGEAVVLDLASGTYYGLNEVATRAWTLLVDGRTLGETEEQLAREFEAPAEAIRRDVSAWLQTLIDKGLVRTA